MSQSEPLLPLEPVSSQNEVLQKLQTFPSPEEKIAFGLQFMREAISQEGAPRFREFWEMRAVVLPLFKQNVNPAIRSKLWSEYVELTIEARRLKDILEEQSAFAAEQIDLAIQALELDISNFEQLIETAPSVEFPLETRSISQKAETYNLLQRELNLLNTLASRLNALRQEVLKTEMRIRYKTKFFKRISSLGDHIFPKRKHLIEQVSSEFLRDIELFVQTHFSEHAQKKVPYYALRDEIKSLQAWAKLLTLNVETFTKTRLVLSECWDKLKVVEKAHKQAFQQKKQVWTENRAVLETRIAELKAQSPSDLGQIDLAISDIEKEMRSLDLGKEEIAHIRREFQELRTPFLEEQKKKQIEQERIEQEKFQQRKQRASDLKERITLLQKDTEKNYDELTKELEEIRKEISEVAQGKFEEQHFERLLRPIKDLILERKESALLSLSDDERTQLQQLREALKERKQLRAEIKEHLEGYRKSLAASNLDFEKAITIREQISLEKERLQKANASIEEIEQKISQIEDRS